MTVILHRQLGLFIRVSPVIMKPSYMCVEGETVGGLFRILSQCQESKP